MKAEKLNVFIESVISFFAQAGDSLQDISTPYLNSNLTPIAYDFTGIITISGQFQGCVYVTAPSAMLRTLLHTLGETDNSIYLLKDLIGEIANTVSGNARTEFGSQFIISPPILTEGAPTPLYLPKDKYSYVIPFFWHEHQGAIGICIAKDGV